MAPKRSTKLSLRKLVWQMGAGASVVALLAAVPVEMNRVGTKAKTKTMTTVSEPFMSKPEVCDLTAADLKRVKDVNVDKYIAKTVKKPELFAPKYRLGWADCKDGSRADWRWEYFTIDLLLTAAVSKDTSDTSAEFLMQWHTLQQLLPLENGPPDRDALRPLEKMVWYGAGVDAWGSQPLVHLEDGLALELNFDNSVSGALNLRIIGKWTTTNATKSFDMEAVASKVIKVMTTTTFDKDNVQQAVKDVARNVAPYDQVGGGHDAASAVDRLLHGGYHSVEDRTVELARIMKDHSPLEQLWSGLMKQRLRMVALGMGNILEDDFAKFVGRFVTDMQLTSEAADEVVYWPVSTEIARWGTPVYIAAFSTQNLLAKSAAVGFPLDQNTFTPTKRILLEYLTGMIRHLGIPLFCWARDSWGFNDFEHGYARGPDATAVLTCLPFHRGGDIEAYLHNSFLAMIVGMDFLEQDTNTQELFMKEWAKFKDKHMTHGGEVISKAEHGRDPSRLSNMDHVVLTRVFDGTQNFDGWADHLAQIKDEDVITLCRNLVYELLLPASSRKLLTVKIAADQGENPFGPLELTLDSMNAASQRGKYPDTDTVKARILQYNMQLQTERDNAGDHKYNNDFKVAELNGNLRKELLKFTKGFYHSQRVNSGAPGVAAHDEQVRVEVANETSSVVEELRKQMVLRNQQMEALEKEKKELEDKMKVDGETPVDRGGRHKPTDQIAKDFWDQWNEDLGMDIWAIFLLFLSILCIFMALSMACATRAASRGQRHWMRMDAPAMSRTTMGITLLLVIAGLTFLWMSCIYTAARNANPKALTKAIMAGVALLGAATGIWSAHNMCKASSSNMMSGDSGSGIQLGERFGGVNAW